MRGIPGIALAAAEAVVMPHHRSPIAVARPPAAGGVASREQRAVGIAAGKDVVPGWRDLRACLSKRRFRREIGRIAVELLDAGRDLDSLRIDPRATTDPVERVDRWSIR